MSRVNDEELWQSLLAETRDMHSAIVSLMEELTAIEVYRQRANACKDQELKTILEHNRDDEKVHACRLLEWIHGKNREFPDRPSTKSMAPQ